jgi:hypothetical protein
MDCRRGWGVATDAMTHPTVAVLVKNGLPLTRENYLNLNNVDEDDLDAEQEGELPQLFQQSMVERAGRVGDVRDRDWRHAATAVWECTMTLDVALVIAQRLVLAPSKIAVSAWFHVGTFSWSVVSQQDHGKLS